MKYLLIINMLVSTLLMSQELKIKADLFKADENKGVSEFIGNVNVLKKNDELNASSVTVFTDEQNKPVKYIATGNVNFKIETKHSSTYEGTANRVVYIPLKKEYHFYENVHLKQIDEKKEIIGDRVILNIVDGKAYAKGLIQEPVIMIFDIKEEGE